MMNVDCITNKRSDVEATIEILEAVNTDKSIRPNSSIIDEYIGVVNNILRWNNPEDKKLQEREKDKLLRAMDAFSERFV